jgi:hypothetical protein
MDRMQHFPSFSIVYGDIDIKLDLSRFEEQYKKAQYELDGNVMNSMITGMRSSGILGKVLHAKPTP